MDGMGWNGMGWNEMGWVGMRWNGMGWNEMNVRIEMSDGDEARAKSFSERKL
jgi:hypothetical protein